MFTGFSYFFLSGCYTTCRRINSLRSFSMARRLVMVTLPGVQPSSLAVSVTESWRKNRLLITVCSLGRSCFIQACTLRFSSACSSLFSGSSRLSAGRFASSSLSSSVSSWLFLLRMWCVS